MNLRALSILAWTVLALGVGYLLYVHLHQPDVPVEVSRLQGQLKADSVVTKALASSYSIAQQRLDSALNRTDSVITRWKTVTKVVTTPGGDPVPLPPNAPVPPGPDSALIEAGNQLQRECTNLSLACRAFRDTAGQRIAAMTQQYSHLDSLYSISKKRPSRWGISVVAGYTGVLTRKTLQTVDETRQIQYVELRPGVAIGLSYKIF